MIDIPKPGKHILYVIIISQFCCTTLWFATNAILPQLQANHGWPAETLGYITSAIQIGFIVGTLAFAVLGLSDRYSPSLVFLISSIAAAVTNAIPLLDISSINLTLFSRLGTGFFLAGVYPVGMKIASDWQKEGLGHWLGALVGALVLGTAFPHALKIIPDFFNPESLILSVSVLSIAGGSGMYLLVKDGPFHKPSKHFSFADVRSVFNVSAFRAPAFGYFGHMWELYAFWAFIPIFLMYYQSTTSIEFSLSLWTFGIIASGFAGCILGGKLSLRYGSKTIATVALACSALCCLLSPLLIQLSFPSFMALLVFWGFTVVADSPQFSALVAFNAPPHVRGSAITITTCIGFAITIVSIQLLNSLQHLISPKYLLLLLAPGPLLGLIWLNSDKYIIWKK
jgi:MFS family permease